MEQSFPLGAGYGRPRAAKRADASINRAIAAIAAVREAEYWEARTHAFERGEIDDQGRRIDANSRDRAAKRTALAAARRARIETALAAIGEKHRLDVAAETWADANGFLRGPARAFVIAEHAADKAAL